MNTTCGTRYREHRVKRRRRMHPDPVASRSMDHPLTCRPRDFTGSPPRTTSSPSSIHYGKRARCVGQRRRRMVVEMGRVWSSHIPQPLSPPFAGFSLRPPPQRLPTLQRQRHSTTNEGELSILRISDGAAMFQLSLSLCGWRPPPSYAACCSQSRRASATVRRQCSRPACVREGPYGMAVDVVWTGVWIACAAACIRGSGGGGRRETARWGGGEAIVATPTVLCAHDTFGEPRSTFERLGNLQFADMMKSLRAGAQGRRVWVLEVGTHGGGVEGCLGWLDAHNVRGRGVAGGDRRPSRVDPPILLSPSPYCRGRFHSSLCGTVQSRVKTALPQRQR